MTDTPSREGHAGKESVSGPAAASAKAAAADSDEEITLFDPEYAGLSFGPMNDIQFGARGGFEPHIWTGPADHPMLDELFRKHPGIVKIGEPEKSYMCTGCAPPTEWKSLNAWRAHQSAHKSTVVAGVR